MPYLCFLAQPVRASTEGPQGRMMELQRNVLGEFENIPLLVKLATPGCGIAVMLFNMLSIIVSKAVAIGHVGHRS